MGMTVQHNITAMNSNRMLGVTTGAQAKSTEKLSSGFKINRAADDASGLSISEKMRKQIRGLTQASSNAQDGISAVQTADGALSEVQDMLQRMNELAVKASNGTNSKTDRQSIQDEIDQLVTEIDRVSETTKFNETYLLKGDNDEAAKIDYKYNDKDEVVKQDLYYVKKDGSVGEVKKGAYADTLDANTTYFTSNEATEVGTLVDSTNSSKLVEAASQITGDNVYLKQTDGTYAKVEKGTKYDDGKTYFSFTNNSATSTLDAVASADPTKIAAKATLVKDGATIYDSKGNKMAAGASVDSTLIDTSYYSDKSKLKLHSSNSIAVEDATELNQAAQLKDRDGNEIASNGLYKYFGDDGSYKGGLYLSTGTAGSGDEKEATAADVEKLISKDKHYETGARTLTLHVGADATKTNQISVDIDAMSAKGLGIENLKGEGVTGEDDTNALDAIETIAAALGRVSEQRSALGAAQNRLEHTIKNLDNVVENTSAAESQIRDTDMASEMVTFSKNNILAQAGQSMLAQANQSNQGVLSLLG